VSLGRSRVRGPRTAGFRLGVLAAAGTVLLAACGGGSPKPEPLTHAELTRGADAACARASARVRAVEPPTAFSGLREYAIAVQSIGEDLERDLEALTPSAQDRAKLDAYRAALRQANDVAGQLATAAGHGDRTAVRSLSGRVAESDLGVLAARAGLSECATAVTLTGT
jgi:hypothetical protein